MFLLHEHLRFFNMVDWERQYQITFQYSIVKSLQLLSWHSSTVSFYPKFYGWCWILEFFIYIFTFLHFYILTLWRFHFHIEDDEEENFHWWWGIEIIWRWKGFCVDDEIMMRIPYKDKWISQPWGFWRW